MSGSVAFAAGFGLVVALAAAPVLWRLLAHGLFFVFLGLSFSMLASACDILSLGMAASRMALTYISGEQRGHGQVNRRRFSSVGRFCFMPWLQSLFVLVLRFECSCCDARPCTRPSLGSGEARSGQ